MAENSEKNGKNGIALQDEKTEEDIILYGNKTPKTEEEMAEEVAEAAKSVPEVQDVIGNLEQGDFTLPGAASEKTKPDASQEETTIIAQNLKKKKEKKPKKSTRNCSPAPLLPHQNPKKSFLEKRKSKRKKDLKRQRIKGEKNLQIFYPMKRK
jgi:rRNA processing protein Gar1